ncbi:sigma-54-dependent transcriptional regulator [Noviherbaspirillum suwonense]|uniref:Two component, sigma54 specific, transcriptional regulator, Fis family n=1 Tax=Noviherbaspirillum suwonense TaxID=1224511 RepID=A0ABY1QS99_9BURK|nr:sigma-54 dependent transcriptional regulator [Noviherbaspirillum suwonense]SMP77382.1 two component, sigma54 specific, transcriptional regulator, Fis family [Noviherbaspirillum suwonense]
MPTLLIVDDDDAFREGLAETLADLGHQVVQAASGREALEQLSGAAPGAIFLDFRLPDMDGLAVLEAMRRQRPGDLPPVVMLTAYATSENTIGAMGLGAFEHLTKPVGRAAIAALLDTLFPAMEAAIAAPAGDGAFGDEAASGQARLLGASDAMRAVQKTLGRAAASDATVLITGETGTGKEVAARVLHAASQRRNGPFVAVNCAAIPHELLESELFGHARGAYTGAVQERAGLIAQADGGTVFLDEIGDMPALMQAKLLRVLQEREVMPLGASRPLPVDVRVVAATHRDLAAMVADSAFRNDLMYRLNVIPLRLPALRERSADIVPLAGHFLAQACALGGRSMRLSAAAQHLLAQHAWPGNVRELKNAIDRVCALAPSALIDAADFGFLLQPSDRAASPVSAELLDLPLAQAVEQVERALIVHALALAAGNRSDAARRLGISRQSLYTKLASLGIG